MHPGAFLGAGTVLAAFYGAIASSWGGGRATALSPCSAFAGCVVMAESLSSSSGGLSPLSGASVPLRVAVSEVAEPARCLCCVPSRPSLPSAAPACAGVLGQISPGVYTPFPALPWGWDCRSPAQNRWWSCCWSGESNCDLIGTFSPSCSLCLARTLGSSWSWGLGSEAWVRSPGLGSHVGVPQQGVLRDSKTGLTVALGSWVKWESK